METSGTQILVKLLWKHQWRELLWGSTLLRTCLTVTDDPHIIELFDAVPLFQLLRDL